MPEGTEKEGLTMTMKEKLKIHKEIEAENKQKEREWIHVLNERIAEEEMQWFIDQGIIA